MGRSGWATIFAAVRAFARPTESRASPRVALPAPGACSVVVRGPGPATRGRAG